VVAVKLQHRHVHRQKLVRAGRIADRNRRLSRFGQALVFRLVGFQQPPRNGHDRFPFACRAVDERQLDRACRGRN
jgi:hypothetical protein